jgi:hypothetical protein
MSDEAQPSTPVAVKNGAEDVVEADVAASDAHHTHLVEGDFFPTEAPVAVEADVGGGGAGVGNDDEANVDEIAAEAAAAVAAASISSTPSKPAAPPSRKRVRWADGGDTSTAHGLVMHVTSFYMPHSPRGSRLDTSDPSSPTRPPHAAAVNPTPSVFRDKVDTDGSTYKFCKAQRPALRFAEWKRQQHEYGSTPFERQLLEVAADDAAAGASSGAFEMGRVPPAPARTLFGVLYQRHIVTRVVEGQVRTRAGTYHSSHADSLQLPFLRMNTPYDEPYSIPLQP